MLWRLEYMFRYETYLEYKHVKKRDKTSVTESV